MSVDTFGHSPSWTHDEMIAAGYITDDAEQRLTPLGQLREDLDSIYDNTTDAIEKARVMEAAAALDNRGRPNGPDTDTRRRIAANLRDLAADEPDGGREDVLSCTADTIDPDRRGVGDPEPETTPPRKAERMTYKNTDEIRRANRAGGYHFFDADTMRSFGSRVIEEVYGDRLFITSERDRGVWLSDGRNHAAWDGRRRYTVRLARDDGSVGEVSDFGQFDTLAQARRHAREMADATPAELLRDAERLVNAAAELLNTAAEGDAGDDTAGPRARALRWEVNTVARIAEKEEAAAAEPLTAAERIAEHTGRI